MKKAAKQTETYAKRALRWNPLVIILYSVMAYGMTSLAQNGGIKKHLPFIIVPAGILFVWLLWTVWRFRRPLQKRAWQSYAKPWYYLATALIVVITGVSTYKIVQSAISFNGRLSWVIDDWQHKHLLAFPDHNLYTDGIDGLLRDIDNEVDLPTALYVGDDFSLSFASDGTIKTVSTYLEGANEEGNRMSFLIDYDVNKSNQLMVRTGEGDASKTFDESKSLQSLRTSLNFLPIADLLGKFEDDDSYRLYYAGMRDWGYNTDGIVYYNETGLLGHLDISYQKIVGFTTSLYPENQEDATPIRLVYTDADSLSEVAGSPTDSEESSTGEFEVAESYQLPQGPTYQLIVLDAALGSRFYGLRKQSETGKAWEMVNEDPFNGETGVADGLGFIDDSLGFATLSHNGGETADLFRTTSGGKTFAKVSLPEVDVPLADDAQYNPFVFPEIPYQEGDNLILYVNQGANGDYKAGVRAVYLSKDRGKSWQFIKEVD